jgi:hypothetical protein
MHSKMQPYLVNLRRRDGQPPQWTFGAPNVDAAIATAYQQWPGQVLDVVGPDGATYLLVAARPPLPVPAA